MALWPCTCTNPRKAETTKQKTNKDPQTTTRKSPSQICVSSADKRRSNNKKGARPNQKQPNPLWIDCIRSGSQTKKTTPLRAAQKLRKRGLREIKIERIQNYRDEPVKQSGGKSCKKRIPEQFSSLTGSLRVLSVVLLEGIIIGQDNLYRVLTWASSQVRIRHLGHSRPSLGRDSKYTHKHYPDGGTPCHSRNGVQQRNSHSSGSTKEGTRVIHVG